jgi:hypothetical protein
LDDSRKAKTVSKELEQKFYSRCPPSLRPLHLGGIPHASGLESTDEHATKKGSSVMRIFGGQANVTPSDSKMHSSYESVLEGEAPMATDQPAFFRTRSLLGNVISRQTVNSDGEDHSDEDDLSTLSPFEKMKQRMGRAYQAVQRLNPVPHLYRRQCRQRKSNPQATEGSYDSSLFKAMLHATWKRMLLATLLAAFGAILSTTSSLVTKKLINYISVSHAWSKTDEVGRLSLKHPNSIGVGIALAIGLALMRAVSSAFDNHSFFQSMTAGRYFFFAWRATIVADCSIFVLACQDL